MKNSENVERKESADENESIREKSRVKLYQAYLAEAAAWREYLFKTFTHLRYSAQHIEIDLSNRCQEIECVAHILSRKRQALRKLDEGFIRAAFSSLSQLRKEREEWSVLTREAFLLEERMLHKDNCSDWLPLKVLEAGNITKAQIERTPSSHIEFPY